MLARVDVLDRDVDPREALAHRLAGRRAVEPAAVRVAAPRLVDRGEVARRRASRASSSSWQQPGAVRAGLGAEDARRRAPPRLGGVRARRPAAPRRRARARRRSSARRARRAPRPVATASSSSPTRCGKASRKKPEMRTVTSIRGRPSSSSGIDLDAGHPPRRLGCHVGRTPSSARISATSSPCVRIAAVPQATRPTISRQRAGVGDVALEQRVGEPHADLAGQLGRQRARVDGVEVAPGRQHVEAPARRRARRPGRDVAAVQRAAARWSARPCVWRSRGTTSPAAKRSARDDAGVGAAEHRRAHRAGARRVPVVRGQRVEQRHLRRLEPVDEVAAAVAPVPGKRATSAAPRVRATCAPGAPRAPARRARTPRRPRAAGPGRRRCRAAASPPSARAAAVPRARRRARAGRP